MIDSTQARRRFREIFGEEPGIEATAHGRVNLIGEHTDYNQGFVLPTLIPQATVVFLSRRGDGEVRYASGNCRGRGDCEVYRPGEERPRKTWGDYVQGITWVLAEQGMKFDGFNLYIDSNLPMGSGLSSSAALEVALLRGLSELFGLRIGGLSVAQWAQRAENEFVGARVGIMDPLVISLAQAGSALFIDTRTLATRALPLPFDQLEILVIDSGVRHQIAHGGYNERRAQCEEACSLLGVESLRELEIEDLPRLEDLPRVLARRARHVITENARVLESVDCLKARDFAALGRLLAESHESLKRDYEVSVPEVDELVALTAAHAGVWGARITGGGFGGSIVAIAEPGSAARLFPDVGRRYRERTGGQATLLVPMTADVPRDLPSHELETPVENRQ